MKQLLNSSFGGLRLERSKQFTRSILRRTLGAVRNPSRALNLFFLSFEGRCTYRSHADKQALTGSFGAVLKGWD